MTIKELARLAGVSVSTVSKIMNQKDTSISAKTRAHVLALAKEYNYKPYASVVQPESRTMTIGVLLRVSGERGNIMSGILDAASEAGYSIIMRSSEGSPEAEARHLNILIGMHIDGLIWEPVGKINASLTTTLEHSKIPYLLSGVSQNLQDELSGQLLQYGQIGPQLDFARMAYQLTESLILRGHTEIACLLHPGSRTQSFYEGYRRCLFDNHLKLDESLILRDEHSFPFQRLAAHQFSGLVVSHCAAALRLYRIIDSLHYSVPYDLSLVSLQDDARLQPDYPPLSTLTIPHMKFGQVLARHLIHMIEKKPPLPIDIPFSLDNEDSIDLPYHERFKKVIVVGSTNIDNYMPVSTLPRSGKTVVSPTVTRYLGGKCINQAMGVARLGHKAAVIGRVGSDADSDLIYSSITVLQISADGLRRTENQCTGQAYIFVRQDGESMITIMSGANNELTPQDITDSEQLFRDASYCLIQTEIPMPAVISAARLARQYQLTTVIKPSACTTIPRELLSLTDLLAPNEDELEEICRDLCPATLSMEDKARFLLSCGVKTVIVTRGARGCFLCTKDIETHIPAASFVSVDSSGAGDAFISALVAYLLYGYGVEPAARIATYAAGFSTTRLGCSASLVDRETLEAYILLKEPKLLQGYGRARG